MIELVDTEVHVNNICVTGDFILTSQRILAGILGL